MHFFTNNTNGQSLSSPDMQEFPAEQGMVPVDECLIGTCPRSSVLQEFLSLHRLNTMNQQDNILHHETCLPWCVIQLQWKMN
jgi:hypothetical protein